MAKCVHPNTVVKIESQSFSVLVWHGLYYYEVGGLQHTRLLQCTINKAHKGNAFFRPNIHVGQLPVNAHKQKLEVTRNRLLILYIFNVFSITYTFFLYTQKQRSIISFILIKTSLPKFFEILPQFLTKFSVARLHPLRPHHLHYSAAVYCCLLAARTDLTEFLQRCNTSFVFVLIFIPTSSHAAESLSSSCWRLC